MSFPHLTNSAGQDLDQVQLTGMLLSCVIGIFPNERHRKQPVKIDLCLYLDTRKAAATTNIHDTLDYAAAVKEVSFILEQCEFLLIESAVDTVCRYFLATYSAEHHLPEVEAVVVSISKPSALTQGIVPAIQIQRRREEFAWSRGQAEDLVIHESPFARLRLRSLAPSATIELSTLPHRPRAALAVGRLHSHGEPLKSRATVVAMQGQERSPVITNEQAASQLVLTLES